MERTKLLILIPLIVLTLSGCTTTGQTTSVYVNQGTSESLGMYGYIMNTTNYGISHSINWQGSQQQQSGYGDYGYPMMPSSPLEYGSYSPQGSFNGDEE